MLYAPVLGVRDFPPKPRGPGTAEPGLPTPSAHGTGKQTG